MSEDLDELLGRVGRMMHRMPPLTVAAEFATLGPVLYAVVGGRAGVRRYREGVLLDDAEFVPLYRRTYEVALRGAPAGAAMLRQVDRATAHDRRENAHLLAAFDLLDPPGAGRPQVLGATRHAAPAAAHAAAKFALLALPTAAGAAMRAVPGR